MGKNFRETLNQQLATDEKFKEEYERLKQEYKLIKDSMDNQEKNS